MIRYFVTVPYYPVLFLTKKDRETQHHGSAILSHSFGNTEKYKQMTGIEPASPAWEAGVLPMNYICVKAFCLLPVCDYSTL